jgi:hypothetical protein
MGIIYLLTHKETGRKYVGQTTQSLRVRLNKHRNVNGCPYIFNAIAKYGLEAFKVEEIGWSLDKEVLDVLETELIDQHQSSYPQGLTSGQLGKESGTMRTPERRYPSKLRNNSQAWT